MSDAETIERIEAILALEDGSEELGDECNEWADVARVSLIRDVLAADGPAS